jgi:nucleoside-diphosphate-sugar epimerase
MMIVLCLDMQRKDILITGAAGFIGRDLCKNLSTDKSVIAVDSKEGSFKSNNTAWELVDLTDFHSVNTICRKYSPGGVIHCAAIAHQKIGTVDSDTYMRVNSEATENLAKAIAQYNPNAYFIFLSTVSVYGEENLDVPVSEESKLKPSSDYAASKLDAEMRLIALADKGIIHDLVILRLAPMYDYDWRFNLERRVRAPMGIAYIRFGSGSQKMSALARPNLVAFINHILKSMEGADRGIMDERGLGDYIGENGLSKQGGESNRQKNLRIFNVCDERPYDFNSIIRVFKKSGISPNRPVISAPLSAVWVGTRIAGAFFPGKRRWLHSGYDKLASDLVFDNGRMLRTGFKPRHSLETVFAD